MKNLVILAGNVGADPEVRTTQSGAKITTISLATSRPKRDSDGKILKDRDGRRIDDTEWHRVTLFNGLGKAVAEYGFKGQKLLVEGRIHYSRYTDSDNVERYATEIIAEKVDFLSRPKSAENENPELVDPDEEIPF